MRTLGGNQQMLCVNESGLYHLIFTSHKEEAKAFRRWVTGEVLPSIRKTGSYSSRLRTLSPHQLLSLADEQALIVKYVERLQNPTARDLGRYLTRYPVATLRQKLRDLSEQYKRIAGFALDKAP